MNTPEAARSGSEALAALVVVEDDPAVRRTVGALLQRNFPSTHIDLFPAAEPALRHPGFAPGTLLLTDLGLPDVHGLELIRRLRAAGWTGHVIVMTGRPTDDLPRELWDLGVAGFVDKTSLHEHLPGAVRRVIAGGMYFSAQVTPARLRGRTDVRESPPEANAATLSPRERDVVRLVATGLISKEVADRLNLSPRTVEKHRASAMRKIGVRSVPQLVYWCLRQGLA